MKKKFVAMTLVTAMGLSLVACGGGGDTNTGGSAAGGDTSSGSSSGGSASGTGTAITIFNSKSEIQDQFVQMAEEYSAKTGVDVEVYYSSDTVAAHLATRYSANDPYTLSMVDAKDVYSLGAEHAIDLSDQEWVGNTNYAISVDERC